MNDKIIILIFTIFIILLFSLNFNNKWISRNYELLKNNKGTWYWFRIFKIKETKENFVKFLRVLSVFVISVMLITIILTLF